MISSMIEVERLIQSPLKSYFTILGCFNLISVDSQPITKSQR